MRLILPTILLLIVTGPTIAGEDPKPGKMVVEEKTVICTADGQADPRCEITQGGSGGSTVDVEVTRDGNKVEKKVIVIRRPLIDGADANKDGNISKAEFLAQAEKHFAELDRDGNGLLGKDEVMPIMPAEAGPHAPHH